MYLKAAGSYISIHPPRAGRDKNCSFPSSSSRLFQSTRPVRGGTKPVFSLFEMSAISIHPPRAGRDFFIIPQHLSDMNFNPPAPCGAGRRGDRAYRTTCGFQSTRPVRGGTNTVKLAETIITFQSTRPVRGGTPTAAFCYCRLSDFNPPAPCGAGPGDSRGGRRRCVFQSTRPVRGGTRR